jgi:hypothetical protein
MRPSIAPAKPYNQEVRPRVGGGEGAGVRMRKKRAQMH